MLVIRAASRRLASVEGTKSRSLLQVGPSTCRRLISASSPRKHEQLDDDPEHPNTSKQYLPPKGWWDTQHRRNFGDPPHEREELFSMWGPDIPPVPPRTALYHFILVAMGFVSFGFITKYFLIPDIPVVRRQYPFSGLVKELGSLEENKAHEESEWEDIE